MSKNNWLWKGPTLDELTDCIQDGRTAKNNVAIIMPSFRGAEKLEKEITYLKQQTFQDFDLVIVYGPGDPFIKNRENFSMVHIRRNDDYGSAGGFYTGERFVIEQGYEYVLLADDDCFPTDKTLIESILQILRKESAVVFPTADVGDPNFIRHLMGFYAAMRADTIRKAGLSWMPFHYYCEDLEWHKRLGGYSRDVVIPNTVVHQTRQIYFFSDRAYYVIRNILLLEFMTSNNRVFFSYLYNYIFTGGAFYLLDRPRACYLLRGTRDFIKARFFRGDPPPKVQQEPMQLPADAVEIGYKNKGELLKSWRSLPGAFNKKAFTDKANFTGLWIVFVYLLTSEFFVVGKKKEVLFHGRAQMLNKLAFIVLLPLLIISALLASIAISIYAHLFLPFRSRKNLGYGVPKQKT